jgi:hypothetical protein
LRHLRKAINEGLEIIRTECRKEKNLWTHYTLY